MTEPEAGRITALDHAGLTFDVFDEGPGDGEAVVLLHGFPERSSTWRLVAPRLHEQGYRTLAMDQRGYSPGARPGRRRDYRIATLAGDAAALIERVGGPAHVVGHDWGAVVAWTLATLRPELVRTLTAVSVPHPTAFLAAMLRSDQGARSWYMGLFQLPFVPELAARRAGGFFDQILRRSGMTQDEVGRFRTEMLESGALTGGLMWYRAIPLLDRHLIGRKVAVPTTFVWSDQDTAVARHGAERTREYVDAPYEFVPLAGVSHWIPTQAPTECADAILRRLAT